MCRHIKTDIHHALGRLEPGAAGCGGHECLRPSRQVTGLPHELEHLMPGGHDLDRLHVVHTHDWSPRGLSAHYISFDERAARSVNRSVTQCRIWLRNALVRSCLGVSKNARGSVSSTIRPASMKITRLAT